MTPPLGNIEDKPRRCWFDILVKVVCGFALAFIFVHLLFWGINAHMEALENKPKRGFTVSGPDTTSGYGYYERMKERGR